MSSFDDMANTAIQVITALAPIVAVAAPTAAPAFDLGLKVIQGVLSAEPTAVSLFNRIKSGAVPTADELAQFERDYDAAYSQLDSDLKAGGAV